MTRDLCFYLTYLKITQTAIYHRYTENLARQLFTPSACRCDAEGRDKTPLLDVVEGEQAAHHDIIPREHRACPLFVISGIGIDDQSTSLSITKA